MKYSKICSYFLFLFKIEKAWWGSKNQWSNSDIIFLVWINEIWKQTLHLDSTLLFPAGEDTSHNQPAAHNPDIWRFHCSALVSVLMQVMIFIVVCMPVIPPPLSSSCKRKSLITWIISDCDKLQWASSQEAKLEVLLREDSHPLSLNELFLLYKSTGSWGISLCSA